MEDKSILIQCDEVTKNMMDELQDEMNNSLYKASKNIAEEIVDRIKVLEKKVHGLKEEFTDYCEDNESIQETIENVDKNIKDLTKSIDVVIESSIVRVINEQAKMILEHNKVFNENLHNLIDSNKEIRDIVKDLDNNLLKEVSISEEKILNKISDIDIDKVNNKLEEIEIKFKDSVNLDVLENRLGILGLKIVEESSNDKKDILEKIDEINSEDFTKRVEELEENIKSNFSEHKDMILKNVGDISNKKDILLDNIDLIKEELTEKIDKIQMEIEWRNKPFFQRLFSKKKQE